MSWRIGINHFDIKSLFAHNIFATNDSESENHGTQIAERKEINEEEIGTEFKNFIKPHQNKSLMDLSRIGYANIQILDNLQEFKENFRS